MSAWSYTNDRTPCVVVLASGADELDAARALESSLAAALGVRLSVMTSGDCLLLPPAHEVMRDGRSLRGDEHEPYATACLEQAMKLGPRAIRWHVEEIYALAWDSFDRAAWARLDAIYASLPGHVAAALPTWFGHDEEVGPWLTGSVEPPGLQVFGLVEREIFDSWHRAFVGAAATLPFRRRA